MSGDVTPDGPSHGFPPVVGWSEEELDLLWREHVDDARRLALVLAGPNDADELVAEAFARVLTRLRAGQGPTTSFRAYLHVTLRNCHRDRRRRTSELPVSDQPWLLDDEVEPAVATVPDDEAEIAARAFATLPPAWQEVLWHVEVEGRRPRDLAGELGLRARAVSSLAHRAREGLRTAYLDQHVAAEGPTAECTWVRARLGRYVRGQAPRSSARRIDRHLETCAECLAVSIQLEQANRRLAAVVLPGILLGALPVAGGAPAWLAGVTAGGGAAGGALAGTTHAGSAALAGIAATTAAAAIVTAVVVTGVLPDRDEPAARAPATTATGTAPAPAAPDPSGGPGASGAGPGRVRGADLRPSPGLGTAPPTTTGPTTGTPPTEPLVRPIAPVAAVGRTCDAVGRLVLPQVTGVRYVLTEGDGRTGDWTVEASPEPGYLLAPGAPTEFHGDLGSALPCVGLTTALVRALSGPRPLLKPWRVEVTTRLRDDRPRPLRLVLRLRQAQVVAVGHAPDGWVCRSSAGVVLGDVGELVLNPDPALLTITCTARRGGPATTTVGLTVWTLDLSSGRTTPAGEVTLSSEGRVVDQRDLAAG
ncbi:sigma-70 family RNA polymerase sigma factor [Pimelobacter simplex]|uniref:sigma-70 family RNA polymerase sigma factor n=1 Tax=Nocardioides simplex TaxID=2045 RepID=UPI003AAFF4CF